MRPQRAIRSEVTTPPTTTIWTASITPTAAGPPGQETPGSTTPATPKTRTASATRRADPSRDPRRYPGDPWRRPSLDRVVAAVACPCDHPAADPGAVPVHR